MIPLGTVAVLMDGEVAAGVLLSPPHPVRKAVSNANNKNPIGEGYLCRTRIVLREILPSQFAFDLYFGRLGKRRPLEV